MQEGSHLYRRLSKPIALFVGLLIVTMIGFKILEGWSPLQGYYAFIRTAFGDWFDSMVPETTGGKIFATFLNIVAIVAAGWLFATLTTLFIEGELKNVIKHKKMSKAIDELKDHYVVCGINNVSRNVVDEFFRTNTPFVIIERRKEAIDDLAKDFEFLYIQGDAADDDILKKAGVERAKGLVSALDSDAGNIFVVISARNLNNKLKIVATAIDASAKPKMLKAGADEVISPTQIGGLRIASVMIRPHVVSFLDTFLRSKTNVRFEEVVLKEESKLIGKPFKAAQEAEELGLSVIAIMKKGAVDYVYNHKIHITMEPGDVLVTLGDQPQKEAFMKIYN